MLENNFKLTDGIKASEALEALSSATVLLSHTLQRLLELFPDGKEEMADAFARQVHEKSLIDCPIVIEHNDS